MRAYVCFGRWDNLRSRLIRWITKSQWSHAWIEFDSSEWQGAMIFHADLQGVVVEPLLNFHLRRGVPSQARSYEITAGNIEKSFSDSKYYLGKKYGFFSLFYNILILLLSKIKINLKPIKDKDKYTCSEIATLFVKNTGINCLLIPGHTWPGLLFNFAESNPHLFKRTS